MTQQIVKLNYLHIAPRKVRLLAGPLRGLPIQEAEAQLLLRPHRSAKPLLKLLRSGAANIRNNKKLNPDNFFISSIKINQGPMLKRSLPRAMGRATPIHKKMSHVVLILEESAKPNTLRFTIAPPVKKEKPQARKTRQKSKVEEAVKSGKPKEQSGFFKRMFRRKSV